MEEEPEVDSQSSTGSKLEGHRRSFAPSTTSSQDRRSSYSRSLPSIPPSPNRRSRVYSRPATPPPPVPPLPAEVFLPSFNPLLLEFHPENVLDPSQTIVALETSTETYRTTWATLMAYPSHLSRYLQTLLLGQQAGEHGTTSDDVPIQSRESSSKDNTSHLGAHIFLDRASTSYTHILQYMRTPTATPTTLPWAIQLESSTSVRIEALLALRDEAKYLDLDLLYRLCCSELGIESSPNASPKSVSFPQLEENMRENFHQRKRVSAATTAVESPLIPTTSIVLDDYFPSASFLKSRTRSNSRSSKAAPVPPPVAQSGWI